MQTILFFSDNFKDNSVGIFLLKPSCLSKSFYFWISKIFSFSCPLDFSKEYIPTLFTYSAYPCPTPCSSVIKGRLNCLCFLVAILTFTYLFLVVISSIKTIRLNLPLSGSGLIMVCDNDQIKYTS